MKQPLVLRFCLLVFVLSCGKDPVDSVTPPTTTTPDPITKKNTISTTTNPAPDLSGKPGETVAVVKLKGTSLKGTPIYDIEEEEWFEALSQKDMGIVTEVFNSLATEKELYDFDQGINGLL